MHHCIMADCIIASLHRCIGASLHRCIIASSHHCIIASLYHCIVVSLYHRHRHHHHHLLFIYCHLCPEILYTNTTIHHPCSYKPKNKFTPSFQVALLLLRTSRHGNHHSGHCRSHDGHWAAAQALAAGAVTLTHPAEVVSKLGTLKIHQDTKKQHCQQTS